MRESIPRLRERRPWAEDAAVRTALLLAILLCLSLVAVRPAPAQRCPGDCNEDGTLTIDELITLVNIALGTSTAPCPSGDGNRDGAMTIDELLQAVNAALAGCGAVTPGRTASPTDPGERTPTASPTATDGTTRTATPVDDRSACCACIGLSGGAPPMPAFFCGFFEGPARRAAAEARCAVIANDAGDSGLRCVDATAGSCGSALADNDIACPATPEGGR